MSQHSSILLADFPDLFSYRVEDPPERLLDSKRRPPSDAAVRNVVFAAGPSESITIAFCPPTPRAITRCRSADPLSLDQSIGGLSIEGGQHCVFSIRPGVASATC